MNTYYVDFSGYCEIKATNSEEARDKFWEYIDKGQSLPVNVYEIEGIEKKEDFVCS